VSHMACVSQKFLAEESNADALIPIQGTCPSCHTSLRWSDLIKELSLRMYGEEALKALFKTKRKKKSDGTPEDDAEEFPDIDELDVDLDEDLDETWAENVDDDEDRPSGSNTG
jgi:structure-specific endonuclease subunit SLX1